MNYMWIRPGSWVRDRYTGKYKRRWRGGKLRNRAEIITATIITATMLKDES